MQISQRISGINGGGTDGWDLYRKAQARIAAGHPVIELTIGEHDVPTDPAILDEMRAAANRGRTGYAEIPGSDALRAAVAARLERVSAVPTTPDEVLITSGGQMALFCAHLAATEAGDRALYIDPHYATYPGTLRSAGLVPHPVTARADKAFQPVAEDLDDAAQRTGARSLLINSPNNPTGAIYSAETLNGIADVATARDMWLISDEVYDSQVWDVRHLSPRAIPALADRTLICGSLSKSHAMTGSRVGWICGPADAIAALEDLATNTTYGIPGFLQDAALHALSLGPEFEAEVAAPFHRRRHIVERLIAAQAVVGAAPMQGAMYALLDIRATGLTGETFADRLLDICGIAVMPGESFGRAAAGHVRVALTVEDAVLDGAVRELLTLAIQLASERKAPD